MHAPPPCCLSWVPQGGCRAPRCGRLCHSPLLRTREMANRSTALANASVSCLNGATERRPSAARAAPVPMCRRLAPVPVYYPPHAHRSHPYPLLRRTSPAFVIVYISDSYSRFPPRSPSLRCLIVSPGFAHPTPRSSFIPWIHRGESCGTFWVGGHLRRPTSSNGIVVFVCVAAAVNYTPPIFVIFRAAAWRTAGASSTTRRLVCLLT